MSNAKPLSFGIKTSQQYTTYEDILRVWQEADTIPVIEHAWLYDHFIALGNDPTGSCLEGWTLLGALAARTRRLRMGLMVTSNTHRHPTVLANIAATVDIISQGRLDFGIGAGWNEVEHTAYDIPLYAPGERIRRFGEACELIKLMWTEQAPDFDGKYYHLKQAYCEPKPVQKPYPPFVIGGSGEKLLLRVVATHAAIWNSTGLSVEEFRHKSAILDQHCAAIGRDPASIERSIQYWVDYDHLELTREVVGNYIEAGVTHLIFVLPPPYPENVVQRLVNEVVEPLKARYEG